jgi:hypothetical protein
VALNERADILVAIGDRGFVWSSETRAYTELPTLGRGIEVEDMDDAGDVVGAATDATGRRHAVLWTGRPYAITKLMVPSAFDGRALTDSRATATNQRGTVVGASYTSQDRLAVAWMGAERAFRILGTGGIPTDINAQDLATGSPIPQNSSVQLMWDVASAEEIRLPMPTPLPTLAWDGRRVGLTTELPIALGAAGQGHFQASDWYHVQVLDRATGQLLREFPTTSSPNAELELNGARLLTLEDDYSFRGTEPYVAVWCR